MKKRTLLLSSILALNGALTFIPQTALAADAGGSPSNSSSQFKVVTEADTENPDNGKLLLKAVPSFDFGKIPASKIYNGFSGQKATADGQLIIADNRAGSDDWNLSVKLDKFSKDGAGAAVLNGAKLNLSATSPQWPSISDKHITDDNTDISLASSSGSTHGEYNYSFSKDNVSLDLGANPSATIQNNDGFQAKLLWSLNTSTPAPATL